jgi:L-ascorbate metabolism protein UlaG (beta-lactamase superfamily)
MATTRKPKATAPHEMVLRSYNVGFGDCFLLTFRYTGFDRHILIDFGSTRAPKGKVMAAHMMAIAKQIETDCEGKLHALVVTHRHKDHISGFTYSGGKGPGAVIRRLDPDLVIQPWTEDPKARRNAKGPTSAMRNGDTKAAIQHIDALHDMNEFAGYVVSASKRLRGNHLKATREQLTFLGDDNDLTNRDAITNLMKMGRKKRYVYFGAKSGLESVLPGVVTTVLGPPTLKQSPGIATQRAKDPDQFWIQLAARAEFWAQHGQIARYAKATDGVLFPRHVEQRHPWDMRWYRYQAQREQAENLLSIVRTLDSAMNNTSVVLLFEVAGKSFLFPGDAQYENWMYALSHPDIVARLAKVDLYKVGHHGSLNATPKDLWNGFTARGTKTKKGRLISVLSTLAGVHGSEEAGTEVPRDPLVTALTKESDLLDTRNTTGDVQVTRMKL